MRHYPDLRIYIAGEDPTKLPFRSVKRHIAYPAYLCGLIDELGLSSHVNFTGLLGSTEMAERMCRSQVFVLPSLIENSPNTLGEAMLLGVPAVAAYVGGIPSMARDEEEALRLAKTLHPAAITLDVMMPGMDGWEVLRELKGDAETRDIPVIMVTMTDDRETGYALGATEFLTKPIDRGQLVQMLEQHAPSGAERSTLVVTTSPRTANSCGGPSRRRAGR